MKITKEEEQKICDVYLQTNSQMETVKITKHSPSTVSKYLIRNGLGRGKGGNQDKQRKITDEQILEAIGTMTRQEIADKYGVHVENLARRMKKLGVSAVYANNGGHDNILPHRKIFGECWHYTESKRLWVEARQPNFEYIESKRAQNIKRIRLKCRVCGCVVDRDESTVRQKNVRCDNCTARENEKKELIESRIELMRVFYAIKEKETPKYCKVCGTVFYSENPNKVYCSDKCKRKAKPKKGNYRQRCRHYGVHYDPAVTREGVIARDNGVCQICGKLCNPLDRRWGSSGPDFPTLDHIIPLAKGGAHTWENSQCACGICNSYKRDLLAAEMEVS